MTSMIKTKNYNFYAKNKEQTTIYMSRMIFGIKFSILSIDVNCWQTTGIGEDVFDCSKQTKGF